MRNPNNKHYISAEKQRIDICYKNLCDALGLPKKVSLESGTFPRARPSIWTTVIYFSFSFSGSAANCIMGTASASNSKVVGVDYTFEKQCMGRTPPFLYKNHSGPLFVSIYLLKVKKISHLH